MNHGSLVGTQRKHCVKARMNNRVHDEVVNLRIEPTAHDNDREVGREGGRSGTKPVEAIVTSLTMVEGRSSDAKLGGIIPKQHLGRLGMGCSVKRGRCLCVLRSLACAVVGQLDRCLNIVTLRPLLDTVGGLVKAHLEVEVILGPLGLSRWTENVTCMCHRMCTWVDRLAVAGDRTR